MVDFKDLENAARLLVAYIESLKPGGGFYAVLKREFQNSNFKFQEKYRLILLIR